MSQALVTNQAVKPGHDVAAVQLRRRCHPSRFAFTSTDELPDTPLVLGQGRAVAAIEFGIGVPHDGYNLFALGATGAGKHTVVRKFLEDRARTDPPARDWCYVHNFAHPHRPSAISLPKGRGSRFRSDIARLVDELRTAISTALEAEEFRHRCQRIHDAFNARRDAALEDLRQQAAQQSVALVRTPLGFALAPMRKGEVIDAAAFQQLSESEQVAFRTALAALEAQLDHILHEVPKWHREAHEKLRVLKREETKRVVDALLEELRKAYAGEAAVEQYLSALEADVVDNADDFHRPDEEGEEGKPLAALMARVGGGSPLQRYQVNLLHEGGTDEGAPVVYEDKPTLDNLIGRIEHVAHMGTLVTDVTHITARALHRANGGYLIVDARRVLMEPFAWDGLKRALRSSLIHIESIGASLSLVSTVSLQAVGGINEKIEGFFDLCRSTGLTGEQGVLIPSANLRHLMLRDDVVAAVEAGEFHVYAVDTIDQGLEVLTGIAAGSRDEDGRFPEGSVNAAVEHRLAAFARQARAFRTADGKA